MTLQQWCEKTGVHHIHPTTETGAVSVIADGIDSKIRHILWHLEDYKVSSVHGVVVWLVPA